MSARSTNKFSPSNSEVNLDASAFRATGFFLPFFVVFVFHEFKESASVDICS